MAERRAVVTRWAVIQSDTAWPATRLEKQSLMQRA
jgi:hypothetical protein